MIGEVQASVGIALELEGYANDYDKAINAVQFSLDDGATWTTYATPRTTAERNVYWRFSYTPELPGDYVLLVRSINEDGAASPEPARVHFRAQ